MWSAHAAAPRNPGAQRRRSRLPRPDGFIVDFSGKRSPRSIGPCRALPSSGPPGARRAAASRRPSVTSTTHRLHAWLVSWLHRGGIRPVMAGVLRRLRCRGRGRGLPGGVTEGTDWHEHGRGDLLREVQPSLQHGGQANELPRRAAAQSATPPGRRSADYYLRQLRDWKYSVEIEDMNAFAITGYGRMCGWTLARAHAPHRGPDRDRRLPRRIGQVRPGRGRIRRDLCRSDRARPRGTGRRGCLRARASPDGHRTELAPGTGLQRLPREDRPGRGPPGSCCPPGSGSGPPSTNPATPCSACSPPAPTRSARSPSSPVGRPSASPTGTRGRLVRLLRDLPARPDHRRAGRPGRRGGHLR